MSDSNKKELYALPLEMPDDIGMLWWDGRTRVNMMVDRHLENAMLKLQGLGKSRYDAPDELRRQWLSILSTEFARRRREFLATKIA